jgi:serine/threonine protein phosphatase PrpC
MAFSKALLNKKPLEVNYLSVFREGDSKTPTNVTPEKGGAVSTRDNKDGSRLFNFLTNMHKKKLNYANIQAAKSRAGKTYGGKPKTNQDSYLVRTKIFNHDNFNLYIVLDGHGLNGHFVSNLVRNFLGTYFTKSDLYKSTKKPGRGIDTIPTLEEIYNKLKEDNYKVIKDAFQATEGELKKQHFDVNFSGTTCIVVILVDDKIICANCGDSRAFLASESSKRTTVTQLSRDHKPDLRDEKQRILGSNGWVEKYNQNGYFLGPYRVFVKNEYYPGLAMSRSIGDFVAASVGVISEPEINELTITDSLKYIVLGSDGVFEFLSNEKIAELVNPFYSMNSVESAVDKIVDEAAKSWLNVRVCRYI